MNLVEFLALLFKKIFYFIFVLFFVTSLLFVTIRLMPGGPVEKFLGEKASAEEILMQQKKWGLDHSLTDQYFLSLKEMISFKLGNSFFYNKSIADLLKYRFINTFQLGFLSVFLSLIIILTLSPFLFFSSSKIFSLVIENSFLLFISIPLFSLAPLMVYFFSSHLGLFPIAGWTHLHYKILPIITLSLPLSSILLRVTLVSLREEKRSQWITVCYAKGMGPLNVYIRILKVIFPTILTVVALQLSVVLSGSLIIENIFDIPGLGSLLVESINNRDYPLITGIILTTGALYLCIFLALEMSHYFFNPKQTKIL